MSCRTTPTTSHNYGFCEYLTYYIEQALAVPRAFSSVFGYGTQQPQASGTPSTHLGEQSSPLYVNAETSGGSWCSTESTYRITGGGLWTITSLGTVNILVSIVTGLPSPAILTGILTVGNAVGAHVTKRALENYSRVQNLEEERRQTQMLRRQVDNLTAQNATHTRENAAFRTNNQNLTDEIVTLRTENATLIARVQDLTTEIAALRSEIATLRGENARLSTNVENLTREITQFAVQNEDYRTLCAQFGSYLESFRAGNMQDREEFSRRLAAFVQQIAASQELWNQVFQDISRFREDYATQLDQLRNCITQLTDPRNTLLRLQEHQQAINQQIQEAINRLNQHQVALASLDAQIALRDGQLRERDQLLRELRSAHQGILNIYQQQNAIYGQENNTLEALINRIGTLVEVTPPSSPTPPTLIATPTTSTVRPTLPMSAARQTLTTPQASTAPVRLTPATSSTVRSTLTIALTPPTSTARPILPMSAAQPTLTTSSSATTSTVRPTPTILIETLIRYDIRLGNVLGIRFEPDWNETYFFAFDQSQNAWEGYVPFNKYFKFIIIDSRGGIRWEREGNRKWETQSERDNARNGSIQINFE